LSQQNNRKITCLPGGSLAVSHRKAEVVELARVPQKRWCKWIQGFLLQTLILLALGGKWDVQSQTMILYADCRCGKALCKSHRKGFGLGLGDFLVLFFPRKTRPRASSTSDQFWFCQQRAWGGKLWLLRSETILIFQQKEQSD